MDMIQGLISDRKYNIEGSFTNIFVFIGILTLVYYFCTYCMLFKLDQFTLRKSLALEKFL
ncbi:hypothetical protein CEXT_49081, partial [Caerostris extrusa]